MSQVMVPEDLFILGQEAVYAILCDNQETAKHKLESLSSKMHNSTYNEEGVRSIDAEAWSQILIASTASRAGDFGSMGFALNKANTFLQKNIH